MKAKGVKHEHKHRHIYDGTPHTNSHWVFGIQGEKDKVCVDFHHVITKNCEACDGFSGEYELQEGAKEAIDMLRETFKIVLFTGNPTGLEYLPKDYRDRVIKFLDDNGIYYDELLFVKPPSVFIIDDRAIHHKSWDETIMEIEERMSK